jgi:hypothetical protein
LQVQDDLIHGFRVVKRVSAMDLGLPHRPGMDIVYAEDIIHKVVLCPYWLDESGATWDAIRNGACKQWFVVNVRDSDVAVR